MIFDWLEVLLCIFLGFTSTHTHTFGYIRLTYHTWSYRNWAATCHRHVSKLKPSPKLVVQLSNSLEIRELIFCDLNIEPVPCENEPKMDDWLENLEWSQLRRSEMNQLIMEYLIHEGFKEAAERFKIEAGIQMPSNAPHSETPEAMERRIQVRLRFLKQNAKSCEMVDSYPSISILFYRFGTP